jgi:hypothetical protein
MPTKKKPLRDLPKIPKELLEQFGEGLMTAEASRTPLRRSRRP